LPVRRHQAEGIPALRLPGMRDPVLFQDHVIDALRLELIAHGKAGLAAADHRNADVRRKRTGHVVLPIYSSKDVMVTRASVKRSKRPAAASILASWAIAREQANPY